MSSGALAWCSAAFFLTACPVGRASSIPLAGFPRGSSYHRNNPGRGGPYRTVVQGVRTARHFPIETVAHRTRIQRNSITNLVSAPRVEIIELGAPGKDRICCRAVKGSSGRKLISHQVLIGFREGDSEAGRPGRERGSRSQVLPVA